MSSPVDDAGRDSITSSSSEPATGRRVPGGKTVSAPAPAAAITRATPSSARTIAVRSKGTSAAQLADERGERLSISSDDAERTGAAVRGVEEVDAAAELVAERLGLRRRARAPRRVSCASRFTSQPTTAPTASCKPERDGDGLEPERRTASKWSLRHHSIATSIGTCATGSSKPPRRP